MEVGSISTWLGISATDLQFSTDPPGISASPYWKSNCIKLSAPKQTGRNGRVVPHIGQTVEQRESRGERAAVFFGSEFEGLNELLIEQKAHLSSFAACRFGVAITQV